LTEDLFAAGSTVAGAEQGTDFIETVSNLMDKLLFGDEFDEWPALLGSDDDETSAEQQHRASTVDAAGRAGDVSLLGSSSSSQQHRETVSDAAASGGSSSVTRAAGWGVIELERGHDAELEPGSSSSVRASLRRGGGRYDEGEDGGRAEEEEERKERTGSTTGLLLHHPQLGSTGTTGEASRFVLGGAGTSDAAAASVLQQQSTSSSAGTSSSGGSSDNICEVISCVLGMKRRTMLILSFVVSVIPFLFILITEFCRFSYSIFVYLDFKPFIIIFFFKAVRTHNFHLSGFFFLAVTHSRRRRLY
jgi:hypothetical protein